ncbi:hypothetical protein HMPREF9148_00679 [Prevotella sp. F0091]|nr:hypothetical protein HMPREF9148_00679 [Prevotella sp. F0091]
MLKSKKVKSKTLMLIVQTSNVKTQSSKFKVQSSKKKTDCLVLKAKAVCWESILEFGKD